MRTKGKLSAVSGLLALQVAVAPSAGGELSGYAEMAYTETQTESSDDDGTLFRTEAEFLRQRYSVNLTQDLFPNLGLRLGGVFERSDTRVDSLAAQLDSESDLLYPFATLSLSTPYYAGELAFERQQRRSTTSGFGTDRSRRDLWRATLGWTPPRLPQSRLELLRTESREGSGLPLTRVENFAQLSSDFRRKGLSTYYRGSVTRREDRVDGSELETLAHSARARFGRRWWNGRVSFSGDVALDYTRNRSETAGGGGEVFNPVAVLEGLSAIDDTPELGALSPNPLLIDENVAAGTGIDLGLPAPGEDDAPRNIGVDLGADVPLNTFRVWIDIPLPDGIASAFSWQIYTSDDNDIWALEIALASAPLAPFDNFFELQFPDLESRYVKVVVAPLAPTVPLAINFPDILVTEIEAFLRTPLDPGAQTVESSITGQRVNLGLRTRLLDSVPLHHELAYFLIDSNAAASRYSLSNGLFVSHRFGQIYSLGARLTRTDAQDAAGDLTSYTLSTSLGAQPLETLRQNLVVSGRREERDFGTSDFASVILHNYLDVRRGVELALSAGRSYTVNIDNQRTRVDLLNGGLTLEPHRTTSITVSLRDRSIREGGSGDVGSRRAALISLSWRPTSGFYVFASHGTDETDDLPQRDRDELALGWSPFPDGTLQFTVRYGETTRTSPDREERRLTPSLRWNVGPRMFLETTYAALRTETATSEVETDSFGATFRANF